MKNETATYIKFQTPFIVMTKDENNCWHNPGTASFAGKCAAQDYAKKHGGTVWEIYRRSDWANEKYRKI